MRARGAGEPAGHAIELRPVDPRRLRAGPAVLGLAALAALGGLTGCRALMGPPPAAATGGAASLEDSRLEAARAVARSGVPSPSPQLDALVSAALHTTPELGLAELLAADGKAGLPSEEGPYRPLRPGDRVQVTIVGQPLFGGARTTDAEGWLEVPPVGMVRAAGLMPLDLSTKVADMLAESYLQERPAVTVSLLEPGPRTVVVVGRVGLHLAGADARPAEGGAPAADAETPASSLVTLPPGRRTSLHELLTLAQGLAADADGERLLLLRRAAPGAKAPTQRCYHFSYRALVEAHLAGNDPWVLPDDQLVVPRLPTVHVYGAVPRPGPQPLQPGSTVASLVLRAGGLPTRGILLVDQGGGTTSVGLEAQVLAGQVLFVPSAPRVSVVGPGVAKNGPIDLPAEGLSAIDAIAAAGWFTPFASRDDVVILRREGSRRVTIEVPVSEVLDGHRAESEFNLEPGDTVLVPEGALGW